MFGRAPRKSDSAMFYEILRLHREAVEELEEANRNEAINNHPDKGGDPEKFEEISHAYEDLSDSEMSDSYDQYGEDDLKEGMSGDEKRDTYDQYGEDAPKEGMDGGEKRDTYDQYGEDAPKEGMGGGGASHNENPFHVFDSLYDDSRAHIYTEMHDDDIVHVLKVSLEDLYNGASKKFLLTRNVICSNCKGEGSRSRACMRRYGCQGTRMKIPARRIGPGMIQKSQHVCNDCRGSCASIHEKDKCTMCKGNKVTMEKRILEVYVEKGMQHGQQIVFEGQADEAPGMVTRDIVFFLKLMEHPKFKRKQNDLFVDHTLSLTEALCGFQFAFTHLDGRQLLIKSEPGEIIKPGLFKVVNDEGMPHYERPFMKGRLYFHFNVEFPDSGVLLADQRCALERILPSWSSRKPTDMKLGECQETTLHDVSMEEMRRKQQPHQEDYEKDDDLQEDYEKDDDLCRKLQCEQQ